MKSTDDIIRQIKDGTLREDASVELKIWLPNKDVLAKVLVGLANAEVDILSSALKRVLTVVKLLD